MKTMIYRLLTIFLSALAISSCATAPAPQPQKPFNPTGGIVGVIFLTADSPTHAHVGTTIFNNFETQIDQDWEFEEKVLSTIGATLGAEYEVKKFQVPSSSIREDQTTRTGWSSRPIRDEARAEFDRIGMEQGAVALVIVEAVERQVDGQTPVQAAGYGVYTRCVLTYCTFSYLDSYEIQVASVPTGATYVAQGDYHQLDRRVKVDIDHKLVKELSSVDLTPIKERLLYAVQQDVKTALANAGFLPAEFGASLDRGYVEPDLVDRQSLIGR